MPAPTTGKPGGISGPPLPNGAYHQPPYGNQPHFQQPPYGGPPPNGQFPPNGGYMWQGQQQQQPPGYGGPGWQGQGPPPPPMGMYRQGGPPPPPSAGMDRGNWNGYRGGPPPPQQGRRPPPPNADPHSPPRQGAGGKQDGGPYWGQQQQQQWPQHQWQGGPPPPPHVWQGGPPPSIQQPGPSPPPNMPQHMQGPPKIWGRNGMSSPVRAGGPRRSPETMPGMMNGYPGRMNGMDPMHKNMDGDQDMYMSRDDKGGKHSMQHDKDKGRGSYRCGRCGAPKKGHVCPYQPKLKRRPDEPPPEMRNAAIQVEMDEFMTVRRLNIEIQGFPESYATAPLLADNMVVGEPHPLAVSAGIVTNLEMPQVLPISSPAPEMPDMMRSSPGPSPVVETGA